MINYTIRRLSSVYNTQFTVYLLIHHFDDSIYGKTVINSSNEFRMFRQERIYVQYFYAEFSKHKKYPQIKPLVCVLIRGHYAIFQLAVFLSNSSGTFAAG